MYRIIYLMKFFILLTLFISGTAFSKKNNTSNKEQSPKETEKIELELAPAPLPIHDMGSQWSGVRVADGVSTYKLKDNPKVIGTLYLQKKDKKVDWKELQSDDFFEKFVQLKQEDLMLFNIGSWKADQHSLKKRKKFIELNITGSYKRNVTQLVFFKERLLYFSNHIYQILVISPKTEALQNRSVSRFFKKAQKIGIQMTVLDQKDKNKGKDKEGEEK